jgi:NlpC/P60 family protein
MLTKLSGGSILIPDGCCNMSSKPPRREKMFPVNQFQSPFATQGFGMSPMGHGPQNSAMLMMNLMQMMMSMMQMIMGSMVGGNHPMSQGQPNFGSGNSAFGGGNPVSSFLGGGQGSGNSAFSPAGGGGITGGAFVPPSDGSVNGKTQNFINKALEKQGAPYVFGAQGNGKYDCSGLVHAALNEAGVKGPRQTARGYQAKYKNSQVRKEDLKPGDLVFFHSKNTRGIPAGQATHIEIYLGNGKTMGTDNPKEGARVENINWDTFIGGARVPELAN